MLELDFRSESTAAAPTAAARPGLRDLPTPVRPYGGPERRMRTPTPPDVLAAALDAVDYGLLVVTESSHAMHVNRAARSELAGQHPLVLHDCSLGARKPKDAAALSQALKSASRCGLRTLLSFEAGARQVGISVIPLVHTGFGSRTPTGDATLLILGKHRTCESLSLQSFARGHGLTLTETRVLSLILEGLRPGAIASRHGVAISTVRTQVTSIRVKTGATSIGGLLRLLSALPPIMGLLDDRALQ